MNAHAAFTTRFSLMQDILMKVSDNKLKEYV